MEPVYTPVIGFARALFAFQGLKFRITGAENIPRSGGAVMMLNHLSFFDFAYAGLAALPAKRLVRFMAKESVFRHPVGGPLMRGMHHIPVDREAGAASFRAAVNALKEGEIVGVFPEATISRSFELKEFKSGAVRMAKAAGVPIVPTVLWGSQRVWTKGEKPRFGRSNIPISITVGEPVHLVKGEDLEEVNQRVRAQMTTLLHQAQESYPALTGDDLKFLPARLGGTAPTPEEAAMRDDADAAGRRERRA